MKPAGKAPPRRNGRWSGYRHLLWARMLELKREPEVVFWVFVFPLLLAVGWESLSATNRQRRHRSRLLPGAGAQPTQSLLQNSSQHAIFQSRNTG